MNDLKKLTNSFKKDGYKPVYFLMGEEPYFIDFLSNYFSTNVIPEEEKSFNQTVLYGKDVSVNDIMSQARQYPFMGDKMLVVVKEAQELVKTIDQFANYFKSIQPSTTIVFCYKYKTLDKRKELYKTLSKSEFAEIFESNKLKDYQVEGWIKTLLSDEKLEIEPKAVAMLVEFLGNDLSKIANEIDKLKIILKDKTLISADLVEDNIGISKEYNNFELIKAVAYKIEAKAFSNGLFFLIAGAIATDIAKQLGINPYGLKDYQAASKIYPMKKVSQNIAFIREIDLKGKGVNGTLTHDDLLKELLIKVLR